MSETASCRSHQERAVVSGSTAVVYEPQAKWKDTPSPAFMNGPVVKIATGLENALSTH
jgi:hypothetical protein